MTCLTILHSIAAAIVFARGLYLVGSRMSEKTDWRIRYCVSIIAGAAPFTLFYPPAIVAIVAAAAMLLMIDRRLTGV